MPRKIKLTIEKVHSPKGKFKKNGFKSCFLGRMQIEALKHWGFNNSIHVAQNNEWPKVTDIGYLRVCLLSTFKFNILRRLYKMASTYLYINIFILGFEYSRIICSSCWKCKSCIFFLLKIISCFACLKYARYAYY